MALVPSFKHAFNTPVAVIADAWISASDAHEVRVHRAAGKIDLHHRRPVCNARAYCLFV